MSQIISFQETLRPVLPKVRGCKDYHDEEQLLRRVDKVLVAGRIEHRFLERSLELFRQRAAEMVASGQKVLDGAEAEARHLKYAQRALRCSVLKHFVGESYRELSKLLAMSQLYR